MKAVIIPIASLFLLSGCVEDDNTLVYDIECQGKSDGWHTTSNTISAADKSSYQFEGLWYCRDQVLWYSQEAGKVNLFGDFL